MTGTLHELRMEHISKHFGAVQELRDVTFSVRPHGQQPTRFLCPRDSLGKRSGVGCHFLLQCVKVNSLSRVPLCATP